MPIIVVESPTKAKTFSRILKNKNYYIVSTLGHVRDLPENKVAIDYNNNFYPQYQIIKNKKKIIEKIKKLFEKEKELYLATDPDREGEAISYHLAYLLGFVEESWPDFKIKNHQLKRIVFHEITPSAINEAITSPQKIRENLVKAQIARRLLDRIVGYEISPILWKKTGKKWLSAGRVQTVALRLIIEREKEIERFVKEKYYQIEAEFLLEEENLKIKAKLIKKGDSDLEITKKIQLFDGEYQYTKTIIDENLLSQIIADIKSDSFFVERIEIIEGEKNPPPPFTTALLQQQAFYQYGYSSKTTMKLAQDLFENGLITYHRTDSFNLSSKFLFAAKKFIENKWGKEYALEKPRVYKTKSKLAQEAHEAIRPTHLDEMPKQLKNLTRFHQNLYRLIFFRAVATQMQSAKVKNIEIFIRSRRNYLFYTKLEEIVFDGFLKALEKEKTKKENFNINQNLLNKELKLINLNSEEKYTNPPPRYNEASLIKSLEQKGIGRPSTYAMILSLIQQRNYVEKKGKYFYSTLIGERICEFLVNYFPTLFDLNFTAKMEDDLDEIANGNKDYILVLKELYQLLKEKKENVNYEEKIKIEKESEEKCPNCNAPLVIRYSKFGKFFACSNYPNCHYTKNFVQYVEDRYCPQCGGKIIIKETKGKKRFYGCENYPKCQFASWRLPEKNDRKD